ncbi:uncharacterized protein LOC113464892 isoform X2 [Ceratina calcarata]|uniref:Uncharacterized protein LOC113464892 isoform X2 n=1 Tax=Ceratina calcarata TaxID=156304 RepID=A0AAJ7S8J2_9HYME|nr:uncharacterized protein LOC113464892 isoform X2 [Ceratina calcarata]
MWQDLDGLGGAGVNSGAHQVDQFGTTELTPEHQKILIDIRRKKTELLLEIQRPGWSTWVLTLDIHDVRLSSRSPTGMDLLLVFLPGYLALPPRTIPKETHSTERR